MLLLPPTLSVSHSWSTAFHASLLRCPDPRLSEVHTGGQVGAAGLRVDERCPLYGFAWHKFEQIAAGGTRECSARALHTKSGCLSFGGHLDDDDLGERSQRNATSRPYTINSHSSNRFDYSLLLQVL